MGDRVAAHAQRKLPYKFRFDPNPGFKSAGGFPGGQVFVGAGILAYMDTEDQLAMVLGHEIEHIALNHCRDRLITVMTEQHISSNDFGKLRVDPFLDGYGHDKEFAADREGVNLAMEAGYSADAAIRLLRTFIILGEQMPNAPKEAKSNLEARVTQIDQPRDASGLPNRLRKSRWSCRRIVERDYDPSTIYDPPLEHGSIPRTADDDAPPMNAFDWRTDGPRSASDRIGTTRSGELR